MGFFASLTKHHREFMFVENAKSILHVAMIQYVAMNKLLGYAFNEKALFEGVEKIESRAQLQTFIARLELGVYTLNAPYKDNMKVLPLRTRMIVSDLVVAVWVEIDAQSRLAVCGGSHSLAVQFNHGAWDQPHETDLVLGQIMATLIGRWFNRRLMINAIVKVHEINAPMERMLKDLVQLGGPNVGSYAKALLRHWQSANNL